MITKKSVLPQVVMLFLVGLLMGGGCKRGGNSSDPGGGDGAADGSQADGGRDSGWWDTSFPPADAEDENCGASPFAAERVVANALFVVDKSKSMEDQPSGFTSNKWVSLTNALGSVLADVSDDLAFGLELYPVDEQCAVSTSAEIALQVSTGSAHVDSAVSTLSGATVAGGTPTAQTLQRALAYFTTGAGAALTGGKYVILATDGGPNCNQSLTCGVDQCIRNMEDNCSLPDSGNCCNPAEMGDEAGVTMNCLNSDATVAAVEALAAAGVTTVVVGIPGSEIFADLLDDLAVAGGLTSGGDRDYFAVTADGTGTGGLSAVLRRVTRELIRTCELQLGSRPPNYRELNVEVDGALVPRDTDDGWVLDTSTDPPTVRLQGASCESMMDRGAENVQVTFGCPSLI